jgi:hypothetical protein
MSKEMTDEELVGYCRLHCETPRALFNATQVNRMLALAGHPQGYVKSVPEGWYSVHDRMKTLCRLATERMMKPGPKPSGSSEPPPVVSLLNAMLDEQVSNLVSAAKALGTSEDDSKRMLSEAQAEAAIHAILWAYGSRAGSFAGGYAWTSLMLALGLVSYTFKEDREGG